MSLTAGGKKVKIEIGEDGKMEIIPISPSIVASQELTLSDIKEEHWNASKQVKNGFKYGVLGKINITKGNFTFSGLPDFSNKIDRSTRITHLECNINDAKVLIFVLSSKFMIAFSGKNFIRTSYAKWKSATSVGDTDKVIGKNGILHYCAKLEKAEMVRNHSSELVLKDNVAFYVLEHDLLIVAVRFGDVTYFAELRPEKLNVYFANNAFEFKNGDNIGGVQYEHHAPSAINVGIMRGNIVSNSGDTISTTWLTQVLSFFRRTFPKLAGEQRIEGLYNHA